VKYATTFSRSDCWGTGVTIAVPGTTVVGDARNRASEASSQMMPDDFSAAL
jgi:hypothetical protein